MGGGSVPPPRAAFGWDALICARFRWKFIQRIQFCYSFHSFCFCMKVVCTILYNDASQGWNIEYFRSQLLYSLGSKAEDL